MKRSMQSVTPVSCPGPGVVRLSEQRAAFFGAGGIWRGWGELRCVRPGCNLTYNQHPHIRDFLTESLGGNGQKRAVGGVVTPAASGPLSSATSVLTGTIGTISSTRRTLDFSSTPAGPALSRHATRRPPTLKPVTQARLEVTASVVSKRKKSVDDRLSRALPASTSLPNATEQSSALLLAPVCLVWQDVRPSWRNRR